MKKELTISEKIELNIAKIFFLANQINRKTEMCCFANDVAHISTIQVRMFKTKEDYLNEPVIFELDYKCSNEYSWQYDSEDRLIDSEKCVSFLEDILKDKKIDYSLLNPVREYVVKYFKI